MEKDFSYYKCDYERLLQKEIQHIIDDPGAIIGAPSVNRVGQFISGYICAVCDLTGYHIQFDDDFQCYVSDLEPTKEAIHWDRIIARGRNEVESFEHFKELYKSFILEVSRLDDKTC